MSESSNALFDDGQFIICSQFSWFWWATWPSTLMLTNCHHWPCPSMLLIDPHLHAPPFGSSPCRYYEPSLWTTSDEWIYVQIFVLLFVSCFPYPPRNSSSLSSKPSYRLLFWRQSTYPVNSRYYQPDPGHS